MTDHANAKFKVPHTFVILFWIIVIATLATYIIPAGNFDRVQSEAYSWLKVIVPGTFHPVDQSPVGIFSMFMGIYEGLIQAGSIVFFIFIAYSYVYLVSKTGAIEGASRVLLSKLQGREFLIIPVFMIFFGICGSTWGMIESTYGLIPIFAGLAVSMGYDAIVGMCMVGLAAATGFASATTNPFTIGVAQNIAGLPMFSGISFRVFIFIVFQITAIWYVMRYAKRIKTNPSLSVMSGIQMEASYNDNNMKEYSFTNQHKLLLIGFGITVILLILGGLKLKWGMKQMAALFLIMAIISGIVVRYSPSKIAETMLEGCSKIVFGALVVGLARAILVIMNAGNITDTIINFLAAPLQLLPSWATAQGMVVIQNFMNFLIPSGSGQAAATIPILAPLSDLVGITRQTAVLAYQFGDGYSNMLWPTAACMVMCAVGKIPYEKWLRFFLPLFGIFFIEQCIFMAIATAINFGPF